jgi:thiamine monophosphate synthase
MTSPDSEYLRIFDANLNRIGEGLRFLEDLARLTLNDVGLTRQLKTMRHDILESDESFKSPCAEHDALFIIDDHLELALAVDADGFHLETDDIPVSVAAVEAVLQADSPEEAAGEIIERLERGKTDG